MIFCQFFSNAKKHDLKNASHFHYENHVFDSIFAPLTVGKLKYWFSGSFLCFFYYFDMFTSHCAVKVIKIQNITKNTNAKATITTNIHTKYYILETEERTEHTYLATNFK